MLDHHKMSPIVREGRRQVQIGPGSDKKRFQNGREGACCVVLVHIYKWCIANFLPSQHQSVWHSCNALHSTAPVHQPRLCTTDANCTELLLCTMVAPPCTAVQCRSVQCTVCTTVQCSASQHQRVWHQSAGTLHWMSSSINQK